MLSIVVNKRESSTISLKAGDQIVSNIPESLTELGLYEDLKSFQRSLMISDGRLTRIVRKVISYAYEHKSPKIIDDMLTSFRTFKTAKFTAAIKAACEGHAFITFENGRAAIKDYGKKARAEKALSAKTFGVLENYEQAQQALAAQRALERKQSVVPLENLRNAKGAIGVFHDEFTKLYDKKSNALERARSMPDSNKNKKECVAYLESQTQVCRVMSLLISKLEGLPTDKAAEFLKSIEDLNV